MRVLFVDDDPEILGAIRHLLQGEDFETLTSSSAEEALEVLRGGDVGVIVSDHKMPKMTGLEFLEKAWEISPQSLRIMLTGFGSTDVARDAIARGGAYRYITKPWKNDELLQTLRDAVTICRLMRDNRRMKSLLAGMGKG